MEEVMEEEFKPEESTPVSPSEKEPEDIFEVKEIEIEEMAIDGVCGVY
jgi:mycofactocin precursor